jgi:hypothetical protein
VFACQMLKGDFIFLLLELEGSKIYKWEQVSAYVTSSIPAKQRGDVILATLNPESTFSFLCINHVNWNPFTEDPCLNSNKHYI